MSGPYGVFSSAHQITPSDASAWTRFGASIAVLGDMNGDLVDDIVAGAPGKFGRGALHVLLMRQPITDALVQER
eukprot:6198676-Pleurochrysis_carterae.AAC.1